MYSKRWLPLLLCLLLCVGLFVLTAPAVQAEGTPFGDGLAWSFDEATGKLTITGSGTMDDFATQDEQPWAAVREQITKLALPDGLQTIGSRAFSGCTGLTGVDFPASLTIINQEAFRDCTSMETLVLPTTLMAIDTDAFRGCTGLSELTLPGSLTMNSHPFYACDHLSKVTYTSKNGTLPSPKAVFDGTNAHNVDVVIGQGIETIPSSAFASCGSIRSVHLPDGLTTIGNSAFYYCQNLSSINIPDTVTSIHGYALSGTAFWDAQSDGLVYLDRVLLGSKNGCPMSVNVKSGTRLIAEYAFSQKTAIISLTIPGSVKSIGRYAFDRCTGLTTLSLGNGVASIEEYAFYKCTALASLALPDTGITIGSYAFNNCTGLTSLTIPNADITIGSGAFSSCTGLTSLTIPNADITIGSGAFFSCTGLASVTLPCSLDAEDSLFYGCTNVSFVHVTGGTGTWKIKYYHMPWKYSETAELTVVLDEGVPSIRNQEFDGCTNLTSVTIPHSVTSIGQSAFRNCSALTSVPLPDKLTDIPYAMLSGCSALTSVTIPSGVTAIGGEAFSGCTGLTSVTIPEGVTSIEFSAFSGCTGLTSVTIPGIECVPFQGFLGCTGLTSVTVESGANQIDNEAFAGCSSLRSITIPATIIFVTDKSFSGCTSLQDVYYGGSEGQRTRMWFGDNTDEIQNATWHYGKETKSVKGLTITSEPVDATVLNGQKTVFGVGISGKATSFQWYYRTKPTAKWKKVSKATKATLTVTGKPGNNGYQYRCMLKNGKGTLYTDPVTLTVELYPPEIVSQPESVAIQAGEEATFTFGVEGENVTYAWSYRKSATGKWAVVKGATQATLTVTGTAANAGYQYKCEAKNKDGSVTSDIVTLDVEYHLAEITLQPKGVKVKKNAKVTFTVEANDPYDEELTFQWYYRKSSKAKWTKIKGATEAAYSFKATAKKNGYQYKCDITNRDGTVSTKAVTLKVK